MPGNINFSKFWAFVGRSVPPLSSGLDCLSLWERFFSTHLLFFFLPYWPIFDGRIVQHATYNLGPLLLAFRVGGIGVWSDRPSSRLLVPHPSTLTHLSEKLPTRSPPHMVFLTYINIVCIPIFAFLTYALIFPFCLLHRFCKFSAKQFLMDRGRSIGDL